MKMKDWMHASLLTTMATVSTASAWAEAAAAEAPPSQSPIGRLEVVARIRGAMPTGVAVSANGRVFVNFPRWGDRVDFTVAEMIDGQPAAFPNRELNRPDATTLPSQRIVSAQSVVIDPTGMTLWIVDTGSVRPNPITVGGPKLIAVDLISNQISRIIPISAEALEPQTYLNDVRFAMQSGSKGHAFVSDSSRNGGIIVVDLNTGQSWRRLGKTRFTMSDPGFYPVVESTILAEREEGKKPQRFNIGTDGLAVSADGRLLYFRSLTSRHLYSVPITALVDRSTDETTLQSLVVEHGLVAGASDGLEADDQGRIYLTDIEHNAIHRYSGSIEGLETIMASPYALWPDTLALANDGYLYFTANQLNRQARFNGGKDKRVQPYMIFRIKTDGQPIRLTGQPSPSNGSTPPR